MISHMRDFLAKTKLRIHPDPTTWATYINLLDLKGKLGEDAGMPPSSALPLNPTVPLENHSPGDFHVQDFQALLIGVPLAEQEVLWRSKKPRRPHCSTCVSNTNLKKVLSVVKLDHLRYLSHVTPCFKETRNSNKGQAGALVQSNSVSLPSPGTNCMGGGHSWTNGHNTGIVLCRPCNSLAGTQACRLKLHLERDRGKKRRIFRIQTFCRVLYNFVGTELQGNFHLSGNESEYWMSE